MRLEGEAKSLIPHLSSLIAYPSVLTRSGSMAAIIRVAWAVIQRAMLPVLLIAAGIGSVVYGAMHHTVPVVEEREEEIDIAPPTPFGPEFPGEGPQMGGPPEFGPPGFGPPGFGPPEFGPPGFGPPGFGPPSQLTKRKVKILVSEDEREPAIIREVTIGGVVLLGPGKLKRTYSGKAPSLCPT
jgi:hypothetical protein